MIFSTLMSDELALLARVSFTGTAMMGPVVLVAVFKKSKPAKGIIIISFLAFVTYLLSLAGVAPDHIGTLRMDLFLYLFLVVTVSTVLIIERVSVKTVPGN
jgi:SSS family solute:Na+ symporter